MLVLLFTAAGRSMDSKDMKAIIKHLEADPVVEVHIWTSPVVRRMKHPWWQSGCAVPRHSGLCSAVICSRQARFALQAVYDAKSEEIGPGIFRFKAEIGECRRHDALMCGCLWCLSTQASLL